MMPVRTLNRRGYAGGGGIGGTGLLLNAGLRKRREACMERA